MKKYKNIIFLLLLAFTVTGICVTYEEQNVEALSKMGSRGDEVVKIQTRLKQWGYLKGNVDGIYGRQTEEAVRYFQRKNGLKVDGIAGPQTLAAIGISSSTTSQQTNSDTNLLARAINAEARGEPYEGQVAVGAVILNRVKHPSFPNSISGVIYQPGAFSSVNDGQINLQPSQSCINAARDALNGWDPSYGSIYFYNPAKSTSSWIFSRPRVRTIGNHVFAK